jgi:ATP-dependent DNA helicase RecG
VLHTFLDTPIEYCKGVGPARAEVLKKEAGIFTFRDLLSYYPYRYVDKTKFQKIYEIDTSTGYVQLIGKVNEISIAGVGKGTRMIVRFADDTGEIELVWFNGVKWLKEKIKQGSEYVVFGKPTYFNGKINITHPEIELLEKSEKNKTSSILQPFYNSSEKLKSKGLDSKGVGKIIRNILNDAIGKLKENLSTKIIQKLHLVSHEAAVNAIHFPENFNELGRAKARLKFEELFFIQLRLVMMKHYRQKEIRGHIFATVGENLNTFFYKVLPYKLTEAQKRVIREIRKDMSTGKQMNRLLQGDVGSGKTLVALMCMLIALDNGFQSCLMAPTEVLAIQHYQTLQGFLKQMGINVSLLTGSVKSAQRKKILEGLSNGDIKFVIGTHALIEDIVRFKSLGLAVIDEQHRFGVAQRAKLWKKGTIPPHILVMTATPIPRTLAMTIYGDLDVSVIDELPPGRKPITSMHFDDSSRLKVQGFMKTQIRQGRQIYVVYPLIFESEALDLKHLMEGYEAIVRDFPLPEFAVSMVHGQMKSQERDYEMSRFVKGETQIMVATTVIEVGVDVPNATVMVIENAERFGLSQLHQLRGRVGRGADQSYCLLMTADKISNEALVRIETMLKTNDGFQIAEADLKLRGPGNIDGLQQSGITDLVLADIVADEKILKYAHMVAKETIESDPELKKPENYPIKDFIQSENKRKGSWSMIS